MSTLVRRTWKDHPIVTLISVAASLVAIIGFVRSCAQERTEAAALDPCIAVIGRWDWLTTGGVVSVAEGGGLMWHMTEDAPAPSVLGQWSCDRSGAIELRWNNNFTETLEMSEDGKRITGKNQQGVVISATRRE